MAETHELMQDLLPTRSEKRRVGRTLGLGESTIYKWCQDPEGPSGRPNPIDYLDTLLDHGRLHHPDAALAVVQYFEQRNVRALAKQAAGLSITQLLTTIQPTSEKEAVEAIQALSGALRQLLQGGACDLPRLLREVEEAERQMRTAAVMIRGLMDAASNQGED